VLTLRTPPVWRLRSPVRRERPVLTALSFRHVRADAPVGCGVRLGPRL